LKGSRLKALKGRESRGKCAGNPSGEYKRESDGSEGGCEGMEDFGVRLRSPLDVRDQLGDVWLGGLAVGGWGFAGSGVRGRRERGVGEALLGSTR
jgi:hypothetical protein